MTRYSLVFALFLLFAGTDKKTQNVRLSAPPLPVPAILFGMHVGYPVDGRPFSWAGDYIPFGSFRLWDTVDVGWSYIQRVAPQSIEKIERAHGVVTVITNDDHAMIPQATGISVELRGVLDPSFDGRFGVTSVRGPRSFTFSQSGPDAASDGGVEFASDWSVLDAAIAKAKGKQILYTFGAVPIWATKYPPAIPIDSLDRDGTLYTVTTKTAHGFRLNTGDPQWVRIAGTPGNVLDGIYGLKSVPDPRTFTFEAPARYLTTELRSGKAQLFDRGGGSDWRIVPGTHTPYSAATAVEPDPQLFRDFVAELVSRYCECTRDSLPGLHIDAYEIWNEPNATGEHGGGTFFVPNSGRTVLDSADAMIPLAKIVAHVVRHIDRTATVVSPAASGDRTSNGIQWLNRFLDDGGARYFDILGYHFYVGDAPPEAMLPAIAATKDALASHYLNRPIWNTEMGWGGNQNPSPNLGPGYLAETYILSWAAGVSRVYWYQWDNQCWVKLRMTTSDADPPRCGNSHQLTGTTDLARAYGMIESWLEGSRITSCFVESGTWVCGLLRQNGDREHILWRSSDTAAFTIPPGWHAKKITNLDGTSADLVSWSMHIVPTPALIQ